jgi:DeoR/GlpR family transcriptional regulator of sugar metabolism
LKIFFSHSSEQKPIVRALRATLPQHINAWVDEDDLLLGDSIEKTLEDVISSKIDYVLLIVDRHAAASEWVAKEVRWALEKEHETGRRIVLPIVVEESAWNADAFGELRDRKFIPCPSASASDIRSASEKIASMLFSRICHDFEQLAYGPDYTDDRLHGGSKGHDDCAEFAAALREIVFPHRDYDPMSIEDLARELRERGELDGIGEAQVAELVGHVLKEGLIPGLVYDGGSIFVKEEHYRWKSEMAPEAKAAIARAATKLIRQGDTIALDAGSTTEAIAKSLSTLIANRALNNLKIITNSLPAINVLLDTAVALGLDENNDFFELHVPGGKARPTTLSITEIGKHRIATFGDLLKELGGADIGFAGANGVHPTYGFTTHSGRSADRKRQILRHSRKRYIVADSTKFGVHEDVTFAKLNEPVTLITDPSESAEEYRRWFSSRGRTWFGAPRARLMLTDDESALREAA